MKTLKIVKRACVSLGYECHRHLPIPFQWVRNMYKWILHYSAYFQILNIELKIELNSRSEVLILDLIRFIFPLNENFIKLTLLLQTEYVKTTEKREALPERTTMEKSIEIITEFQKSGCELRKGADCRLVFHKTTNHHPSNNESKISGIIFSRICWTLWHWYNIGYKFFIIIENIHLSKMYKRERWTGSMSLQHLLLLFSTSFDIIICSINRKIFHSKLCYIFLYTRISFHEWAHRTNGMRNIKKMNWIFVCSSVFFILPNGCDKTPIVIEPFIIIKTILDFNFLEMILFGRFRWLEWVWHKHLTNDYIYIFCMCQVHHCNK